ncbi:hypothetical protein [Anaplasma phagocytophilum]|uniref:hypothetical protein n=1 Tax=Anaplasma phagocytophilum TaxID=948 RepID=UPI000762CA7C|nr:hypothetical protein [Anaplasma phagocytophilum]
MKEDIQKVSGFVFFKDGYTLGYNAKKYLISIHCRTGCSHYYESSATVVLLDVVADVKMGVCNSVIMVLYLFLGLWRKSFLFISVE